MATTPKFNTLLYVSWTLLGIVAIGILQKVIKVPMTHDETATAIYYAKFSAWKIMMYPDPWPNNHILNSLLVKFCITIFGAEQWSVRLPSFISFGLYAWGAIRISTFVFGRNNIMLLGGVALFAANPYLLDFFGLSRGYGMAAAMALLSLSYMVEGCIKMNSHKVWIAIILGALASYANFTLLFFLAAVLICSLIFFSIKFPPRSKPRKWIKHIGAIAAFVMLYGSLIYTPIVKMQSTNQFKYWTSNGFFNDTIFSSTESWRYNAKLFFDFNRITIAYLVVAIVVLALVRLIWISIKSKSKKEIFNSPLFICTLILILTGLVNILQNIILGTPNLNERTALFFYPLFIAVFLSLLEDVLHTANKQKIVAITLSLGLVAFSAIHLIDRYNRNSVRDWMFDAYTFKVLDHLNNSRINDAEIITLKTHWLYHPSFNFYTATGKVDWLELYPYDKNIDTLTNAQYYYLFNEDFELLKDKYEVVHKLSDTQLLLKKKELN